LAETLDIKAFQHVLKIFFKKVLKKFGSNTKKNTFLHHQNFYKTVNNMQRKNSHIETRGCFSPLGYISCGAVKAVS